jgi:hypothetical protein
MAQCLRRSAVKSSKCLFYAFLFLAVSVLIGGCNSKEMTNMQSSNPMSSLEQTTAIPAEDIAKIEQAAPEKASVKPKNKRLLLVFNRCEGFKHSSIPYCANALRIIGEKTGAFEVFESNDMNIFEPEFLNKFDAVCFNNTTMLKFEDTSLRQSLMDFVKGGKGVIGIHAATDNFYNWPQAAEMMGGLFDGHPWHEKVAVKIEKPDHPACDAFKGQIFEVVDEIYQFKAPYSRDNLEVLLSLDMSKTSPKGGRLDGDYAVSWIRLFEKGRVFYCSLGHDHEIFWNPLVLKHYLDGIQFAMGDLKAD